MIFFQHRIIYIRLCHERNEEFTCLVRVMVRFDFVTHPSCTRLVTDSSPTTFEPSTIHVIWDGGLLTSVVHMKVTVSPFLASIGPDNFILAGGSVKGNVLLLLLSLTYINLQLTEYGNWYYDRTNIKIG